MPDIETTLSLMFDLYIVGMYFLTMNAAIRTDADPRGHGGREAATMMFLAIGVSVMLFLAGMSMWPQLHRAILLSAVE